jgi:hypothetical protein
MWWIVGALVYCFLLSVAWLFLRGAAGHPTPKCPFKRNLHRRGTKKTESPDPVPSVPLW